MMQGQLTTTERAFLRNAIIAKKPNIVLEIGTWKGGGSTWQIVNALKQIGSGHLHTCDVNPEFLAEARKLYVDSRKQFITIHQEFSYNLIQNLLDENKIPDFVFFDGPNDAASSLHDFLMLEPRLVKGAQFCMHDWDSGVLPGGLVVQKSKSVRPYLEQSSAWTIMRQLGKKNNSVGIVLATKN